MMLSQVKNIHEYNLLIQNLNPLGRYQIFIYIINVSFWLIAGVLKTIFDLEFEEIQCPYARSMFQTFGIVLAAHIACLKNRRFSMLTISLISLFGVLLCFLASFPKVPRTLGVFGVGLVGMSVYSLPYLSLCIVCELTKHSLLKNLLCLSLAFFCIFKMVQIPIIEMYLHMNFTVYQRVLILLLPATALQLLLSYLIDESPRAKIDHNFEKAEILLRKIIKFNALKEDMVLGKIDDYFLLKRINIQRRNLLNLFRFPSLTDPQYYLLVVMLILGINSECPHYVLSEGTMFTEKKTQIYWISGFQLVGILGTFFIIKFSRRKLAIIISALLISILNTILFSIEESEIKYLVLQGLNAVFSVSLFFFLIYNAIEFYPHSLRTIGLGAFFSFYYLGSFLILFYLFIEPTIKQVLELFCVGSWVIFLHTWGLRETMGKGLFYQVKEIQEQQQNDQY